MSFSLSFAFFKRFNVCCFFFVSEVGRVLNRRDLALGNIPEAWTLLVNLLIKEVLFSLLCFSTFTFTAVISEYTSTGILFLQGF